MERVYKFRGKRLLDGKWAYGYYWSYTDHYFIKDKSGADHDVDPATVSQYTGQHDENKRDIYGFDILTLINVTPTVKSDIEQATGVVTWDIEGCDYNLCNANGEFIIAFGLTETTYRIMGNAIDNPELLPA